MGRQHQKNNNAQEESEDFLDVIGRLPLEDALKLPLDQWHAEMERIVYSLGALHGAGYIEHDPAWSLHFSFTIRRADTAGLDLNTKLVEVFERAATEARRNPALAVKAFPSPHRSLFSSSVAGKHFEASFLPAPFDRFVRDQFESSGLPEEYVAMALVTVCAAAIGTVRVATPIDGHGWREPAIMWTALVGDPGSMKSPALGPVARLAEEIEAALGPENDERRKRYRKAQARYAAEMKAFEQAVARGEQALCPDPEPPDAPEHEGEKRFLTENATPEKLIRICSHNPRGVLGLFDELAAFWRGFDTYNKGSGRQMALSAFQGLPSRIDRVNLDAPLVAEKTALSVLGGVQSDVLADALRGANDGFFERFNYLWPAPGESRLTVRKIDTDSVRMALAKLRLLDFDPEGEARALPLMAGDLDTFRAFNEGCRSQAASLPSGLGGWVSKGGGRVLRLALVLEYMRWAGSSAAAEPDAISEESYLRAQLLWETVLRPHAERVFGLNPADDNDDARSLANYLVRKKLKRFNASEIRAKAGIPGLDRSEPIKQAIDRLVEADIVFPDPARAGTTRGRSRRDYIVNPRVENLIADLSEPI